MKTTTMAGIPLHLAPTQRSAPNRKRAGAAAGKHRFLLAAGFCVFAAVGCAPKPLDLSKGLACPPQLAGCLASNVWTWVSGGNAVNSVGSYGSPGVAAAGNVPGGRFYASSWIDSSGNFWLWGGFGYASAAPSGYNNDLWEFDGTNWTWVSGSNAANSSGSFGAQGTTDPSNVPSGRNAAVSWIDSFDDLWLFGGSGYDSTGVSVGSLNDLWVFDGANWTWVSGSNLENAAASYGTQGIAAAGNVPGARFNSISWIDASDNLWLFGGDGIDSTGTLGLLNDLWVFDGVYWTWVSGSNLANAAASYGTQGVAAAGNVPGGRNDSVSWIDGSGNLWLFGGIGYDSTGTSGNLNDLWMFDGANWTWVSGSSVAGAAASYGTPGVAAAGNVPGSRYSSISWIDASGNLWLFGGNGTDSAGVTGQLNDLWKFDGTDWTWVSGGNLANAAGSYGPLGVAAAGNVPPTRQNAVSWIDGSGNLWLFGGANGTGNPNLLNDLWVYQP